MQHAGHHYSLRALHNSATPLSALLFQTPAESCEEHLSQVLLTGRPRKLLDAIRQVCRTLQNTVGYCVYRRKLIFLGVSRPLPYRLYDADLRAGGRPVKGSNRGLLLVLRVMCTG